MQKKVFAVRGPAGCGKSKTVKSLCGKLISEFAKGKDVRAVLEIGEVRIGIESDCHQDNGSPVAKRLAKSLKRFAESGCDIIICASLSSGKTFQAVKGLEDLQYQIEPVQLNHVGALAKATVSRKAADDIVSSVKKMIR